jgi:hypothetical protein
MLNLEETLWRSLDTGLQVKAKKLRAECRCNAGLACMKLAEFWGKKEVNLVDETQENKKNEDSMKNENNNVVPRLLDQYYKCRTSPIARSYQKLCRKLLGKENVVLGALPEIVQEAVG